MTQNKYKKLNEENNQEYVSRVVNAEDKPMRADDVLALTHKRYCKLTRAQVSSCLTDSVVSGRLTKWRDIHLKRIVYAPLSHKAPQHIKSAWGNYNPAKLAKALTQDVEEQLITDDKFPNFLTTLANFHQVSVKEVQKEISDVINDITMNDNDDKANTLITCLKDICAEAFE